MWGNISLLRETVKKQWSFPFDWSQIRNEEINQVKEVLKIIDQFDPNETVEFVEKVKVVKPEVEIDHHKKRKQKQELEEAKAEALKMKKMSSTQNTFVITSAQVPINMDLGSKEEFKN